MKSCFKRVQKWFIRVKKSWEFWSLIGIIVVWSSTFFIYKLGLNREQQGQFGDMFGAVNALFSGFAFLGIIITIRQQKEELELQRKELQETKEEFKNQNFQTTFFNLLKTQREIINDFNLNLFFLDQDGNIASRKTQGRGLFRASKKELRKLFEALSIKSYEKYNAAKIEDEVAMLEHFSSQENAEKLEDYIEQANKLFTLHYYGIDEKKFTEYKSLEDEQLIEKLKFIYERFFAKNEYAIGHYFRHFYHLLKFLDKSEKQHINVVNESERIEQGEEIAEEFLEYAEFIKAQVDVPELVLLFYNSMNYDRAKKLLIKYQIFDVLYVGNLIQEEHDVIQEYNLIKGNE